MPTSRKESTAEKLVAGPKLPGIERVDAGLMSRLQHALQAKGARYQPRTHLLNADGSPRFINRLILSDSPYLLQHAHNPVNWHPWNDEAFAHAKAEGKPIFLSIGYSTCHWCHVMESESFEDEEIAAYLNAHFIAIKVDREQRPDVDALYMRAVQMLTGHGGWPMTVVMTPERDPFFAGTYFPPRDGSARGRQGLASILKRLQESFASDPKHVTERARHLSRQVVRSIENDKPGLIPDSEPIERVVQMSARREDPRWGGFGDAPKFPRPVLPELILKYHRRTGNEDALQMVVRALEGMLHGGLYDHLGGGFHRYSTDAQWLVPHFEKMLYDNAQLTTLLLHAYQLTGRQDFRKAARDTLEYIKREMTDIHGGFYSATDADSLTPSGKQEEGYYFTWTPSEFAEVLGDDGHALGTYFGVTEQGNLDGRSTLTRLRSDVEVARELALSIKDLRALVDSSVPRLLEARAKRPAPGCDRKVLTAWNGLMIGAFAQGGLVLADASLLEQAKRAADFILAHLRDTQGRLLRSYYDGHASHLAYLDDHAFLIAGLLDLLEVTSEVRYLDAALGLQRALDSGFWDSTHGGYFMAGGAHEELIAREKPLYDGAEPSGNAVAVMNLLRLHEMTGDTAYRKRAEQVLSAFAHDLVEDPGGSPALLAALERYLDRPRDVFLVRAAGSSQEADAALMDAVRRSYIPNRTLLRVQEGAELAALSKRIPALAEKVALHGKATAYVCEHGRCELPAHSPSQLASQLAQVTPLPRD